MSALRRPNLAWPAWLRRIDRPAVQGIKRAAHKRSHADTLNREATEELRNYRLIARGEGIPDEEIAEAAGLSHHDLHHLFAGHEPL